jgi:hypothetical protein
MLFFRAISPKYRALFFSQRTKVVSAFAIHLTTRQAELRAIPFQPFEIVE